MEENLEVQLRKLQEHYWSESDPEGRGFVSLADLYRRSGDLAEARRILRDGLSRHGKLASGHVVLGWVFLDQGNPTEAEAAFRAALSVDRENIGALKGLSNLLLKRGETQQAVEPLRALYRLDPLDPDVPIRLEEVEAQVEALAQIQEAEDLEEELAAKEREPVWEDGEEAAESLNWDAAALQEDRSAEEKEAGPAPEDEFSPPGAEAPEEGADALVTRTMGEIYMRQGLLHEARSVFLTLLDRNPGDEILVARMAEVEELMGQRAPRPEAVEAPEPYAPPPVELEAEEAVSVADLAPDVVVPIADLAPDEPVEVAEPEPEPESIEAVAEPEPEPEFIEAVAEPEPAVPVAELAPEPVVPIEDLAPDVIVPIAALAPDEPPEDPTLDDFEAWLDNLR